MLALERGAASMGAAVAIGRLDMTASALRAAASREKDGAAARRILALALVLDGADRKTAAETCGMDRQTLRDWVHRYNAEGLTGLHDLTPPGLKPKLTAEQQAAPRAKPASAGVSESIRSTPSPSSWRSGPTKYGPGILRN
jgi:transposase-like protein